MFCSQCRCEFVGWTRCPNCKTPLVEELAAPLPDDAVQAISYEALLELVRENGGQLELALSTADVGREKKWHFPKIGYGYAWANKMQGRAENVAVDLHASDVGKDREWSLLGLGQGFAWVKEARGNVGGNEFGLTSQKVGKDSSWNILGLGFGYAWVQEMAGECGARLQVGLAVTGVARDKKRQFPGLGYGFAWASKGVLTLTLNE